MTKINFNKLSDLHQVKQSTEVAKPKNGNTDFLSYLQNGIKQVNTMQKAADKMAIDLASGKKENIHETMLALSQAELSFNLLVQVRNKALEAYQEVMRMQV